MNTNNSSSIRLVRFSFSAWFSIWKLWIPGILSRIILLRTLGKPTTTSMWLFNISFLAFTMIHKDWNVHLHNKCLMNRLNNCEKITQNFPCQSSLASVPQRIRQQKSQIFCIGFYGIQNERKLIDLIYFLSHSLKSIKRHKLMKYLYISFPWMKIGFEFGALRLKK